MEGNWIFRGLGREVVANPDAATLAHWFQFPGGAKLTCDLLSPPDQWVMVADGGQPLDRAFDRWPLLAGEF